jgi:tetratricopeptide (TPR) repeat protein
MALIRHSCPWQIHDQRAAPARTNDYAPFTARTAVSAGRRRDGPAPLMAARAAPVGAQTAAPARGVTWPARTGAVPPLAAAFTMRTDSLPRIEVVLVPGAVVALVPDGEDAEHADGWLRSCGKTQLAAYLAESLWQSRGIEVLAWVNASSRASLLSGYTEAAARLGLDHGGDAEQAAGRFLAWLGSTARPWLVVLDDLRTPADLDGLLPSGPAGRVLITAADAAAVVGQQAVTVPVPAFSPREAMAYLFDRLTTDPDQRSGGYDLAQNLGGEPAALAHACAVMLDSDTGCRAYHDYFARQRERLRAASGREPPAAAVTWMLSADYAEELLPGGGTWPLLVLAVLLDSHAIPPAVLTAPATCQYLAETGTGSPPDPQHAQSAVQALERAGLVSAGPSVRVSTALQAAARAAAPADLFGRAVRAAADAVLETWPENEPRSALAAQMRGCAATLLRYAGDMLWDGGSCHRVLLTAGQSLTAARITGPAVAWWREITARCDRLLGRDHPDTLIAAGQLAGALLAAGQHTDAVHCARWVVDGRDHLLGPGHPAAIAARISLGRALAASGADDRALQVLREAAARSERAYGHDDPQALAVFDEYAAAFLAAGDTATAVRFSKRSLAGREELHGRADHATLAAALRLASACLADGDTRAAISHYRSVLAARQRALGPDDPDTLAARAGLAAAYDAAGQIGDALREYQQACEGYERVFSPDHPVTLARRADLASAYYAAGQLGDAVTVLHDSILRAEQTLPPDDPVTRRLRQVQDGIAAGTPAE